MEAYGYPSDLLFLRLLLDGQMLMKWKKATNTDRLFHGSLVSH